MAEAKKLVPLDDLPANLVPASDLPDGLSGAAPSSNVPMANQAPQADISLIKSLYDVISLPVEPRSVVGTYGQSIADAVLGTVQPKQEGTFPGRQINDFLAARGAPNIGAAVATATELPGMAVRGAAGGLNTISALLGIPAAGRLLNEGVQNVGSMVGLPDRVSGTLGTTANLGTNLLSPGKWAGAMQTGAQRLAPHLPGAVAAILEKQTANFGNLLTTKIGTATERLEAADASYKALKHDIRVPLDETSKTLGKIIASEEASDLPSPALNHLARLKAIIDENGGGLSPMALNEAMTNIGKNVKSLKATLGFNADPLYSRVFASLAKDANTKAIVPKVVNASESFGGQVDVSGLINARAKIPSAPIEVAYPNPKRPNYSGYMDPDVTARKAKKSTIDYVNAPGLGTVAIPINARRLEPKIRYPEESLVEGLIQDASRPGLPQGVGKPMAQYGSGMEATDVNRLLNVTKPLSDVAGGVVLAKRAAYREKKSLDDIQVIFDKLVKAKRGYDSEFRDFNAAQMINHLAQRPKLVEGVPAADMADLERILVKIAELPNLPPPKGVMYGSGKAVETAAMAGGMVLAGGGSAKLAAQLGGILTGFAAVSRALLPSAIGRKAILGVLDSGPINQTKINMLAALAHVVKPSDMRERLIGEQIREALKQPLSTAEHEQKIQMIQTNNQ